MDAELKRVIEAHCKNMEESIRELKSIVREAECSQSLKIGVYEAEQGIVDIELELEKDDV